MRPNCARIARGALVVDEDVALLERPLADDGLDTTNEGRDMRRRRVVRPEEELQIRRHAGRNLEASQK